MATIRPAHRVNTPPLVYELYSPRDLPSIDISKCVKHVVFSQQNLRRFNSFTYRGRLVLGVGYWLGNALLAASLFVAPPLRGYLAALCLLFQAVPITMAFLVLRFDMVLLLLATYEFWYLTLINVIVAVLAGLSFGDGRWAVLVPIAYAFELALLMDANARGTRTAVIATAVGALVNVLYVVTLTFAYIPDTRAVVLAAYGNHTLFADDVVTNALGSPLLLMLRNAYRMHKNMKRSRAGVYTCITYRCRTALRLVTTDNGAAATTTSTRQETSPEQPFNAIQQLKMVRILTHFDERGVVLPVARRWRLLRPGNVYGAAVVSILATVLAFWVGAPHLKRAASIIAVVASVAVFVSYMLLSHRQLLLRLQVSFDFMFVSFQISLTCLCMADIVGWTDPRAGSVMATWLLLHWVLIVDAVLPHDKTRSLGYHPSTAAAVVVLFLVMQVVMIIALVIMNDGSDPSLRLHDRLLVTLKLNDREKPIYVVPLLFGRFVTTFSWCFRLLWRLWDRHTVDGELIMLQGLVQFDNPRSARKIQHVASAASNHGPGSAVVETHTTISK